MQKQNLKSESIWHVSKWNERRKYISMLKFTRNLFIFNLKKKKTNPNERTKICFLIFSYRKISNFIYIFVSSSNLQIKIHKKSGILEILYLIFTGLFHKAIAQSGVAINPWAILTKEPSKYAYDLAAKLGKESTDPKTVLEFLRTVDAQKLAFTETQLLQSKVSPLNKSTKFSRVNNNERTVCIWKFLFLFFFFLLNEILIFWRVKIFMNNLSKERDTYMKNLKINYFL